MSAGSSSGPIPEPVFGFNELGSPELNVFVARNGLTVSGRKVLHGEIVSIEFGIKDPEFAYELASQLLEGANRVKRHRRTMRAHRVREAAQPSALDDPAELDDVE